MKYFYVSHSSYKGGGVAFYSEPGQTLANVMKNWELKTEPFPGVFNLRDGAFFDYLANNMGVPLFSERFRDIVLEYIPADAPIIWKQVRVFSEEGDTFLHYYIPCFIKDYDVLIREKSIIVEGFVVKPYFDYSKCSGLDFFNWTNDDLTRSIVVSERLAKRIKKELITGIMLDVVSCIE